MDDVLRAVFDAGEAIVVGFRHELEPHQRRLLASLGAGYIIDAAAPPCVRQCGRKECTVSTNARTNERVSALGLGMASLGSHGQIVWEPNWIDYRSSVANVERRRDVGEVPATCDACGCETDITPAPHSPKCPTHARAAWTRDGMLAAVEAWAAGHGDEPPVASDWMQETTSYPSARQAVAEFGSWTTFLDDAGFEANTPRRRGRRKTAASAEDGRELLERMDAGEPVGLEEAAAVGEPADSGAATEIGEPERAAVSSSLEPELESSGLARPAQTPADDEACELDPFTVRRRRRKPYTRGEILTAFHRFHDEHGRWPLPGDVKTCAYLPAAWVTSRPTATLSGFANWQAVWTHLEAGKVPTGNGVRKFLGLPVAGGRKRSEREPQADTTSLVGDPGLGATVAGASSRSEHDRRAHLRVPDTGLTYRSRDEALIAADEIEADGDRVAEQARFDGNDPKAAEAIAQSHALAERIRAAAEKRAPIIHENIRDASDPGASNDVEKPEEPSARLLVTPDEMPPFQRALASALIAGMRAAADALEQELAA